MDTGEEIPRVWSELVETIDFDASHQIPYHEDIIKCELIGFAEYNFSKAPKIKHQILSVPISCFLIKAELTALPEFKHGFFFHIPNIDISNEDMSFYLDQRDITFCSDSPIIVIVYQFNNTIDIKQSTVVGLGIVDGNFLTIVRNFS